MEERSVLIRADDSKLETMVSKVWCEDERPIVAVPADFKLKRKDSWTSGYVMLTCGAFYLFKAKVFGGLEYSVKFHLLDIRVMTLRADRMILGFDDFEAAFKTSDVVPLAIAMLTIVYEATFGIKDINLMKVESEIPFSDVEVRERPKSAIKRRAILLAHFYDIRGAQLQAFDYFQKWEEKQKPMVVMGPSFHPGNFAQAIGHALGWESRIDGVCFQGFAPTKFGKLLDSLLANAFTITKIVFMGYRARRIATFEKMQIIRTSVTTWWFVKCCQEQVFEWAECVSQLPENSVNELMISGSEFKAADYTRLTELANTSEQFQKLKVFEMGRVEAGDSKFPLAEFTGLVSAFRGLEKLIVNMMDCDASSFLAAICEADTHIRSIEIGRMQFKTALPTSLVLPSSLIQLSIPGCVLTPSAMSSILRFLTSKPIEIPIVFQAPGVITRSANYMAISLMSLDKCYPCISEFDWSNNTIQVEHARWLFAFLFTQKRIRLLSFNNCQTDDQVTFLKYIVQLGIALPLYGLDFSHNRYEPAVFVQFLQALYSVKTLRRLNVSHSLSGDMGLGALNELVKMLEDLNEIGADGFGILDEECLCLFWKTLKELPNLKSCDYPVEDLKTMGVSVNRLEPQTQIALASLKSKSKLTSADQRIEYTMRAIRANTEPEFSPDIFALAPTIKFKDRSYDSQDVSPPEEAEPSKQSEE